MTIRVSVGTTDVTDAVRPRRRRRAGRAGGAASSSAPTWSARPRRGRGPGRSGSSTTPRAARCSPARRPLTTAARRALVTRSATSRRATTTSTGRPTRPPPSCSPTTRRSPPTDVATTTTDQGVTVPFVVRRERGFQDRDRYTILTLFRPGQAWTARQAAAAVEPQGAGDPRRRVRCVVRARGPAVVGLLRDLRRLPRHHPELRDGPRHRVRGAVDRARQHRPQLLGRSQRRVGDDGQGAAGRALRHHPLHDRHRLLGRLDRPAHRGQRLSGHLPGPGHHLLLPRHLHRRRPVRRLPPAPALLRGPVALGARGGLVAHPDGPGRGAPEPRQRGGRRRGAVQGGPRPRARLLRHPRPGRRRPGDQVRLRDQPGRCPLLGARPAGQPARPASPAGVDRPGAGGRPWVRRRALRQHRRALRACRRSGPG